MSEHSYLKEQKIGTQFSGVYYVAGVSIKKAKNNNEFMDITLKDKSGQVFAKLWSVDPKIVKGLYVKAVMNVDSYQNAPSYVLRSIVAYDQPIDPNLYIQTVENEKELVERFENYMKIAKETSENLNLPLARILESVFTAEFKAKFFKAPSNTGTYYGKVGGALENTINLCIGAMKMADIYKFNPAEQAVLITSALLSRIGCIDAYKMEECNVEQTLNGALVGVQNLSSIVLFDAWKKIEKTTEDKPWFLKVYHAVTSLEGTETVPSTKEAILLKSMIGIDSKIVEMFDYIDRDEHIEEGFTTFDVTNKRRYYVGK